MELLCNVIALIGAGFVDLGLDRILCGNLWRRGDAKNKDNSRSASGMTNKKSNGQSLDEETVWVEKRVSPLRCSQKA